MRKYILRLQMLLSMLASIFILSSCGSSKDVLYFQDMEPNKTEIKISDAQPITVQPGDKISIIVNCRDPQLTSLFNLPIVNKQLGADNLSSSSQNGVSGYTVDENGNIDFPVIGAIHVAGKQREEITKLIKDTLIKENLVKDPNVTVEFMNLRISVLGEVNTPGCYSIDRDCMTVVDALSLAGDLTIYGNRTKVMVLRQEDGMQRVYGLDLTSGENVYSSPAYYLQQNDIIYVEPNKVKARQSTVNGNNVRSTSFWISLASLLTSVAILILN